MSDTHSIVSSRLGSVSVLQITLDLRQLPEGKLVLAAERTNYRGVTSKRSWDVTPGKPVAPAVADVMAYVGQTIQDHFCGRGAV